MKIRGLAIALTLLAVALVGGPVAAQTEAPQDGQWSVPRTPSGQPDLQGIWTNNVATPLERPVAFEGKDVLTDEELAELKSQIADVLDGGDAVFGDGLVAAALKENSDYLTFDETTGNYSQVWLVEREIDNRTSLLVDPPDGRLPAMTAAATDQVAARGAYLADHPADSWEDRMLNERCITFGLPNLLAGYNSYYQVFQTDDHVAILQELIHDVRIIPLDDRPHVDDAIRHVHGDSRARWEGDTLVVETTNFAANVDSPGALAMRLLRGVSEELSLVERFTRVGPDRMNYEVTVTNPTLWDLPWTILVPLSGTMDPIFEYACHEGNYGMEGILAGHRVQEQAAAGSR
jgi:hypothetical protein